VFEHSAWGDNQLFFQLLLIRVVPIQRHPTACDKKTYPELQLKLRNFPEILRSRELQQSRTAEPSSRSLQSPKRSCFKFKCFDYTNSHELAEIDITLFVVISCSGVDLTIDANFQSAVASQLRRHVHDVVMAGSGMGAPSA